MAPKPSSNRRQHFATAWLLANCAVIVLWPGSLMAWYPEIILAVLAWPIVALTVMLATIMWSVPLRRRLIAIATALCGIVLGWESVRLGPMFHVWWRQDAYLEQARAALLKPPPPSDRGLGYIAVDHSDAPPVRVAFFWFAEHGEVDGLLYDPTGLAAGKAQDWLYDARPRHMFGPWYRF